MNAGTGSVSPVAFDTTTSDEIHPAVSSDGRRIAYGTFNPSTDVGIQVTDLRSGQTAAVNDQVDPGLAFDSIGICRMGRRC